MVTLRAEHSNAAWLKVFTTCNTPVWHCQLISTTFFFVFVNYYTPVYMFYGIVSVLVVFDQSAVPDKSSSEKNFIGYFTIVYVHY